MDAYGQDEWKRGEKDGPGGPLPTVNGQAKRIFREVGKGTLNDPCVSPPTQELTVLVSWLAFNGHVDSLDD